MAGCDFSIPADTGLVNLDGVNVKFTSAQGTVTTLEKVTGSCSADDQYYVEGSGNEATIKLCPATCERQTTETSVDIEIPCASQ
ncbi:MAG: hypothetical protein MK135_05695 [Polyangiaceae bacterium]|nr:hypothetical protein [Polyangiaceae bacterium]